jgi:hypothetical protein
MKNKRHRGKALNPDLQASRYTVEHLFEMQKRELIFINN